MRCCLWLNIVNCRRCVAISVLKKTDLSKLKLVGRRDGPIHDHSRWIRPIYRHQFTIQFCLFASLRWETFLSKCGTDDLRYPETPKNWNKFKKNSHTHAHTHACVRACVCAWNNFIELATEEEERRGERNFERERMWVRMKNEIHKEKHRVERSEWEIVCDGQPIVCVTQFVYWVHALFCSPKRNVRERTTIIDEKKIVQWTRAFARKYQMYNSSTITTFSWLTLLPLLIVSICVSIYCTSLYCLLPVFSCSFSQSLYDLHFLVLFFVLLFIFLLFSYSFFVCSPL